MIFTTFSSFYLTCYRLHPKSTQKVQYIHPACGINSKYTLIPDANHAQPRLATACFKHIMYMHGPWMQQIAPYLLTSTRRVCAQLHSAIRDGIILCSPESVEAETSICACWSNMLWWNHDALNGTVQSRPEGLSSSERAHVLSFRSQCFCLSGEPGASRVWNSTPLLPIISVIQNLVFLLHSKSRDKFEIISSP